MKSWGGGGGGGEKNELGSRKCETNSKKWG